MSSFHSPANTTLRSHPFPTRFKLFIAHSENTNVFWGSFVVVKVKFLGQQIGVSRKIRFVDRINRAAIKKERKKERHQFEFKTHPACVVASHKKVTLLFGMMGRFNA